MVVGRVVYAGSKLGLSNRWADSAIWELIGVEGEVDVNEHCYEAMDKLIQRQGAIQRALGRKHLREGSLVLYDITSSYFEGEYKSSEVVKYGYNRDGKKGHEQMVIGLISNSEGCPIGVEVFAGNTQDGKTVVDKIEEVQSKYGIKEIIFVGDRGMLSRGNYDKVKGIERITVDLANNKERLEYSIDTKVEEPTQTIKRFNRQFSLNKIEVDAVDWAWEYEKGDAMYHIVQTYTRASQYEGLTVEMRYKLQKIGGRILGMLN